MYMSADHTSSVIFRAHSFPRAAEFLAEPQNLPLPRNFNITVEFREFEK